jgi:protein disulfide-isomerase A1
MKSPTKELKTKEEIKQFILENNNQAVIGYFKEKNSDYEKFIKIAEDQDIFEQFPCGEVIGNEDIKIDEMKFEVFRNFGEEKKIETKDLEKLTKFILQNGFPLLLEISQPSFLRYMELGYPLVVLFLDYEDKEEKEKYLKMFEKLAEKTKNQISWTFSNGKDYKEQVEAMGGKPESLPQIAGMNLVKRLNYPYNGEINEEEIEKWVYGILDGSIKPYFKSEPVPEKNDEDVYVVVGSTYESVVMDQQKDVFCRILCTMVWSL